MSSRGAMWPGSERRLNVNVRCATKATEKLSTGRRLGLVHAEIAILDVASSTG